MIETIVVSMNFIVGALIGVELLLRFFIAKDRYDHKDSFTNLSIGIANRIVTTLLWSTVMLGGFTLAAEASPLVIEAGAHWWAWPLALLMSDFSFYWYHRSGHEFRLLWSVHCVHHNSEDYNLSTSVRLSWIESSFRWLFWLPLPLVGFSPLESFFAYMIIRWWQVLLHTEYVNRLGIFEWFMSTPSHHRVHHGSNPQYIDKNYGGVLIIWDRIFGSFQKEEEKVVYGTLKPINTYNPLKINFRECYTLAKDVYHAPGVMNKVRYLYKSPGWSHLATGDTLESLFAEKMLNRNLEQRAASDTLTGRVEAITLNQDSEASGPQTESLQQVG